MDPNEYWGTLGILCTLEIVCNLQAGMCILYYVCRDCQDT